MINKKLWLFGLIIFTLSFMNLALPSYADPDFSIFDGIGSFFYFVAGFLLMIGSSEDSGKIMSIGFFIGLSSQVLLIIIYIYFIFWNQFYQAGYIGSIIHLVLTISGCILNIITYKVMKREPIW